MVLRAKKMALFDFDVTNCKTKQKWQKDGHFTTPVPVDPFLFGKIALLFFFACNNTRKQIGLLDPLHQSWATKHTRISQ